MVERDRDDAWLAARLKTEADRYEPDLDRIRERIRERGTSAPANRSSWLLPAAAAATFVVLSAGAITAVQSRQSHPPQVQAIGSSETPSPSASSSVAGTSTSAPTDPPTTPSGPTRTTSPATSGAVRPSGSPRATTALPRTGFDVQVATADSGQAVTLPGGADDWIAAAPDSAGETIRSVSGGQRISGPHETGSATSTTTSSPFSLSWTGGLSGSSATGSRKWRTVSGPRGGPETGVFITVPAGKQVSELVLYIGASGADGQLRTQLGSTGKETRTRLKAKSGGGYVVTIRFRTAGPGDELTVKIIGGSGGSISFAAASLR